MRQWSERGKAGQAAGDKIKRRIHFAHWTPMATNTHSEYVIIIPF
jgi:hypothetical protein